MRKHRSQGFTVVEAMVGMAILMIAFISSLTVFDMVQNGQNANEASIGFAAARNQIVSLLIDDTSWSKMIGLPGAADNPKLSCLLKQGSTVLNDRDCFGQTDPIVIYNIKGQKYTLDGFTAYDFRSPTLGYTPKGKVCNTYQDPPALGDPACPYHMVVTWTPLCTASPCINPPMLFEGKVSYNGGPNQRSPNVTNLGFRLIKATLYCPIPTIPDTHTSDNPATVEADPTFIDRARSLINTNTPTTDVAYSNQAMAPCRRVSVTFSEGMSAAYTPDANNNSSVYLRDETTGANVFEFRRIATGAAGYDYQLLYKGAVVVANKPSWVILSTNTVFKFEVTNGLVRFCVDSRCPHYFPQKLDFPFRAAFRPASSFFSPAGYYSIGYGIMDY